MKKKNLLIILFLLIILCGCSKNASKSSDEFKSIMRDQKFYVMDTKEQFSEYDYIKESFAALDPDEEYLVEFYVLSDAENALSFYDLNKNIFMAEETDYSVSTNKDKERKNKYTLTTDDKYKVISRIDSTVLYVDAPKNFKNDVKKILKKLGY